MTTTLPGIKSAHQRITPACRENRGCQGAFDEAVARIRSTYAEYSAEPDNAGVTWHLALVRDDGET